MNRLTTLLAHRATRNTGFTLIEMLVVVVIIAILIGVAVRIIGWSTGVKEKAVTLKKMDQLRMAIEEYRAEYGQYPPVDRRQTLPLDSINYMMPDWDSRNEAGIGVTTTFDEAPFFVFGLLAYLMPRYECDSRYHPMDQFDNKFFENPQWSDSNRTISGGYLRDNGPRDVRAWQKWKPFVDDIIEPDRPHYMNPELGWDKSRGEHVYIVTKNVSGSTVPWYALMKYSVFDGWRNSQTIKYRSDPPHTTYRLWCERDGGRTIIEGNVGF